MTQYTAQAAMEKAATPSALRDTRSEFDRMNQQGFKRFRRRAARRGADPAHVDDDIRINLPARLPDTWDRLPLRLPGVQKHLRSRAPLISFFRNDPAAKAFDLLRTRLLQTLRERGWQRVAVTGPTSGCGSTFTAVNLALSLARVPGSRNILMDLNQRTPGIADLLDMHDSGQMRRFLCGEAQPAEHLVRICDTLAVGLTQEPDSQSAELLQTANCTVAMANMVDEINPDVVIYDLPPMLEHDDLAAFLPQVDGVLLVSDATRTTPDHLAACERILGDRTELLGVILNRAKRSGVESLGA
ncbi:CpsD/CapB family tyrosine-protein kinase [Primorskyibacter sp. S87]|uniref:CpsD/CapB family tyrosine-protein kinase n=1 Tax=Primorskyibacter sp. S87 TaxID=3415126 RepID=UPI003C7C8D32